MRRLSRSRKAKTPFSELNGRDFARMAGVYTDRHDFIDAMLAHCRGPFDSPPADWQRDIARRLAAMFFDECNWTSLRAMVYRFLSSEERARAAQAVLLSFLPNAPETGEADRPLRYVEAVRVWEALERVAWTA